MAPPIRSNIWFPAPRPFHPGACKRRQRITDQISTTPSSTAAAASPQLSAAFSAQRSSENHPPPKPLPRQIPIEAKRSPLPRAFVLRRLSDAGPLILGRSLAPGRHPKPFTKPAVDRTAARSGADRNDDRVHIASVHGSLAKKGWAPATSRGRRWSRRFTTRASMTSTRSARRPLRSTDRRVPYWAEI